MEIFCEISFYFYIFVVHLSSELYFFGNIQFSINKKNLRNIIEMSSLEEPNFEVNLFIYLFIYAC